MDLPLTPETGMFPDTYVAPFVVAPEVAALADDVARSFPAFNTILDAIAHDGLRIRYVFETKPFDPAKEDLKPHTIAKVTKAGPLWRVLAETELVIAFRRFFWDTFTPTERRAVLHHELSHIEIGEPGEDGQVKVSLREHDIEEFAGTVLAFGPGRDHRSFFRAYALWHDEQAQTTPTPLRPVEALVKEVIGHVIDDVNAGALGPGVTASRGRRNAEADA